ncbi:hypothetical protein RHECNPAF_1340018 [Rhizobium etli CNPAF512]|nr:hypothetical protein RHECNPAF_1340018 [Rhizobium etli CNPAF512]
MKEFRCLPAINHKRQRGSRMPQNGNFCPFWL